MTFHVPSHRRLRTGEYGSNDDCGNNGAFFIPSRKLGNAPYMVIASDGEGWEHVSVSLPNRCPTWDEMCFIKSIFWDSADCVMQLHPPQQDWVNNHSFCLHLWRPVGVDIPRPPAWMVGVKDIGVLK